MMLSPVNTFNPLACVRRNLCCLVLIAGSYCVSLGANDVVQKESALHLDKVLESVTSQYPPYLAALI